MHRKRGFIVVLVFAPLAAILIDHAFAQQPARPVGFFITSSTSGPGDLGGLRISVRTVPVASTHATALDPDLGTT